MQANEPAEALRNDGSIPSHGGKNLRAHRGTCGGDPVGSLRWFVHGVIAGGADAGGVSAVSGFRQRS